MLKDTTSRGLFVRVRPPHTSERPGGGKVVSKEVGEEERGGCVHRRSDWEYVCERTPSATSIPQSGLDEKEEEEEEKLKFICQCTLMML